VSFGSPPAGGDVTFQSTVVAAATVDLPSSSMVVPVVVKGTNPAHFGGHLLLMLSRREKQAMQGRHMSPTALQYMPVGQSLWIAQEALSALLVVVLVVVLAIALVVVPVVVLVVVLTRVKVAGAIVEGSLVATTSVAVAS